MPGGAGASVPLPRLWNSYKRDVWKGVGCQPWSRQCRYNVEMAGPRLSKDDGGHAILSRGAYPNSVVRYLEYKAAA